MSGGFYDAHVLVFRRNLMPTDAAERRDLEASIRYLYRWQTDRSFRAFLFLTDCAGQLARVTGWALRVIGLDKVRQQIFERLKGGY